MPLYVIRYQIGTWAGLRSVQAENDAMAIAEVRAWASKESGLPMPYMDYKGRFKVATSYRVAVSVTSAEEVIRRGAP